MVNLRRSMSSTKQEVQFHVNLAVVTLPYWEFWRDKYSPSGLIGSSMSAVRTERTAHLVPSGRVSARQGDLEPVSGFEPLTVRLQEACSIALGPLPAPMPHESATTAHKTLGFSAAPFHDPFHACPLAQVDGLGGSGQRHAVPLPRLMARGLGPAVSKVSTQLRYKDFDLRSVTAAGLRPLIDVSPPVLTGGAWEPRQ